MRTKNYIEFINEISSDLLKRASDKATSHGQKNLSKKFSEYTSPIKMNNDFENVSNIKDSSFETKVMNSYVYDIYVDEYNLDGDDIELGEVVKAKIIDYDNWGDDYHEQFVFFISFDINHDEELSILSKLNILDNINVIEFDHGQKFTNKKSAIKFIEMLKKLYMIHNPNRVSKALSKINDTDLQEVEGNGFYSFINDTFGSWENFKKRINIRKLYDTY